MIPFLRLGPLTIPTFGLMVALAMVAAYLVLRADIARRKLAPDPAIAAETFIAVPCLVGIVGAKLYHVLESPRSLLADPIGQLFSRFGLAWFGGLIAGFAAYAWLARFRKIPPLEMFDAGSPAAALGYGIGRIGCLLSGDGDYGIPTKLPWGMSFPNGLVPTTGPWDPVSHSGVCSKYGLPENCAVHPTPIYEFILACIITWVLWRLGTRQLAPARRLPKGTVFAAYLILAGLSRFLIEFIRINPRSFFDLTNAQAASLVSAVAGVGLLWYLSRKARTGLPTH